MILKGIFAQICAFLKLSGALEEFIITSKLWAQNCKNHFLKKIRVLSAVFFQIEEHVISNPSC